MKSVKTVGTFRSEAAMPLVTKSVAVHGDVWRQLRVNAELSGVAVRDYLTFLILKSNPVQGTDSETRQQLSVISEANKQARQIHFPSGETGTA